MIDFNNTDFQEMSDTIDNDFNNDGFGFERTDFQHEVPTLDINSFSEQDIFQHKDPLKYAQQYEFQPLQIDMNNQHFVDPHHVKGYTRQDGTIVDGYYRDGDGNTNINRTTEQGGGYFRRNASL